MTVTGIIAEFNPLHNGHAYLLQQAEGLRIVAMSGNFMQRGEPAIVDKWTRAEMALASGADLVVELPFLVAVQSADYFAQGAVDILAKLGISQLTFGTEELMDYNALARTYADKGVEMVDFLSQLPQELSYPQKAQAMWSKLAGIDFSGASPNHILALAYTKAVAGRDIELKPVKRLGAGFHDSSQVTDFASATAIRKHAQDRDFLRQVMPQAGRFEQAVKVSWDTYFPFLRYQILTHPDLTTIFQVSQELASRICSAIGPAKDFDDLVERVATKRYTKARIRRVLTYILVQAKETPLPSAIRVLGFSSAGQTYLAGLKKRVPLVTRIGQDPWDEVSQQADRVYQLGSTELLEQNWGRIVLGPHSNRKKET
ncbi:nucleotidyltransferase [Streptococcus cuniculipharyngis]|uniref:tRNA(Met) cytidine acetate ligase n=1 Tax=Streptococcus cuniculipharyngis TaxID=1562651 RepID=A0A5C5SDY4_9STRE|nr:nucleotidyltransferase [Streptococcus cuniculipharyngis]TWS98178.1 nucleotidyltransferase [Streptococcus cuniculipharyngis]